jgi:hypothetical protein
MSTDTQTSHQCVGCRAWSPPTETEHTLISAQHGWRLTRRFDDAGTMVVEWRCPACWARYKQRKNMTATPLDGVPAARLPDDIPPSSTPRSRR